jgi:biopolymer transport protein ExbB
MGELRVAWEAVLYGGAMVYPLLLLGALAVGIILDRAVAYSRCLRLPTSVVTIVDAYGFSWADLADSLKDLGSRNAYARLLNTIASQRFEPAWWVESRAGEEAGEIERTLSRGLWVLETAVTAAPLLGLLGTITGMMQAFKVIGGTGLVAPTEVTGGVAQALIATALGLLIALVALFAFNFFSRTISRAIDTMERLASRLVDRIRLDQESESSAHEAAERSLETQKKQRHA